MNILSLVSQNLDNFYQIQTECYRNSDTVFFSPIHRTKRGPRVLCTLKYDVCQLLNEHGEKKKVIFKSFIYFYPKSFFSALFPTTRSHGLNPESRICFCTRLNLPQIFLSCAFLTWIPVFLSFY
jgi:hypothetical protein